MSDASPALELGPPRPLREDEAALIQKLIAGTAHEGAARRQLSHALVQDMSDGGMGSIQFCAAAQETRNYGGTIGEGTFQDADGVVVSVGLNVDQSGNLFELDVWKVDFLPLIRYPDMKDLKVLDPDRTGLSGAKREGRHA